MRHYLKVFKGFVDTSAAKQMSFRIHFALVVLMEIIYYATGIFTIKFLFNYTDHIGPWGENTFLFFISFLNVISNFQMILLAHNYWQFSEDLKTGYFDFIILKPISSIFTVFFRYFRFSTITTLPISIGLLVYFGTLIPLSMEAWFLLPIMIILGFVMQAQLEFIISSFMFWTTQGNGINFLRMQMHEVTSQPEFVYAMLVKRIMIYLFPIAFIGSLPTQFLLDVSKWHILIGMLVAIAGTNLLLRFIWKKGVARYESASS